MRWCELLVATAALCAGAAEEAGVPHLVEICVWRDRHVDCSCTPFKPVIDVVSSDTSFLVGAETITMRDCPMVKLPYFTLDFTAGYLKELHLHNLSRLEMDAPLPRSLRVFNLTDVDELISFPLGIFQWGNKLDLFRMKNVSVKEWVSDFFMEAQFKRMEISDCKFPVLGKDSMNIVAGRIEVVGNEFKGLNQSALRLKSTFANVSKNVFEAFGNNSIEWQGSPNSTLHFKDNIIRSVEKDVMWNFNRDHSGVELADNLVQCRGELEACVQHVRYLSNGGQVCEPEDMCLYRNRSAMRELASCCACDQSPLSGENCAFLVVSAAPSVVAHLTVVAVSFVGVLLAV